MVQKSDMRVREAINTVAGPRGWSETRESWLARAARLVGVTPRSMRSAFYGGICDPEHKVVRRIISAAEVKAKAEANELASRFQTIAAGLNATDPDFHREDIAALIGAARMLGGLDRP